MFSRKVPCFGAALLAVLFCALNSLQAGDAPEPKLGHKGKLLLEETFSGADVPKGWTVNTGKLHVADGVLHAGELKTNNHIGAFRYHLPLQDAAIQIDFRFDGARIFNLGFDPAKGELKKKGHLYSVMVSPGSWWITEHNDKANPESKSKVHVKAKASFEKGKWYTLLLEAKGDDVMAQVAGMEPLKASAPDFHVKKPGLVFRMGGKDDDEVCFDNVKVWELK